MTETFTMIVAPLAMRIELLPFVNDGCHRSTVAFEMWDPEIGQSEEILISLISEEDADEE
jgi:hypothetical protein